MAGIYIHIPFCKTRCIYCDFFSSTSMSVKKKYIEALCKEIGLQRDYLDNQKICTLYFGGGTPSQLTSDDFSLIFSHLTEVFTLKEMLEITIEVNPDDITPSYLESLHSLPFNRISIGIQSFHDKDLKFLRRRHCGKTAIRAVNLCKEAGFKNISIDLMYGLPNQTLDLWKDNLQQAVDLDIQHISAYHLIYETDTELYQLLEKKEVLLTDENLSVEMFSTAIDFLTVSGFEHYEISNFCKEGYISIHNSSYWDGTHYLGLGASAHSYNGVSRQWNVCSIDDYIQSVQKGILSIGSERIDAKMAYNDYILTQLRTSKGIDLDKLEQLFGTDVKSFCLHQSQQHLRNKTIEQNGNILRLTRSGIFISDGIMSDLMQ